jgi:hypothetical protein
MRYRRTAYDEKNTEEQVEDRIDVPRKKERRCLSA